MDNLAFKAYQKKLDCTTFHRCEITMEKKETDYARYELPGHRIKILGLTIFALLAFLIVSLSRLEKNISVLDMLLIPIIVVLGLWLKRFLNRYSKIGFLINELGMFNLDESLIFKMDEIERIDVSPYTFKSANGFIILLKTKSSFKFIPGLYWRLGNRISIGGLVSKNESKFLSTTLLELYEQNLTKN